MAIWLDRDAVGANNGRLVPVGGFAFFAGSGAPNGYLVADGSSVAVIDYPNLFAVLGYSYGGAGANFSLPDCRGLVLAGQGLGTAVAGLTNHVLGSVAGSETHTMTAGELVTHTHVQNAHTHTQDAHTHTQDSHNHTQDSHNHTQDAHTHTQNSHNHTQDSHNHTQNSHTHMIGTQTAGSNGGYIQYASTTAAGGQSSNGTTATNIAATATNQAATATNQNTTATNIAATATNQAATATNQNTTATNQNTTATNQNAGSSTPFSVEDPKLFVTICIAY